METETRQTASKAPQVTQRWNNNISLISREWGGNNGKLAQIGRTIREFDNGKIGNGVYDNIYTENPSEGQVGSYSPDIVYLMIGTNDVLENALNAGSKTLNGAPIPNAETRLTELIDEIYRQKPDVVLFVSTIPEFSEEGTNWQHADLIDDYNEIVSNVVNAQPAGREVVLVDGHSAITVSDLGDGLHPTNEGHRKLGAYVAEQIYNYLQPSEEPVTPDDEPEEEPEAAQETDPITKYELTEKVTNVPLAEGEEAPVSGGLSADGIVTLGKDNKWTASLIGLDPAYEYYAVEIGDKVTDYTPIYLNNGQEPGSGTPIVIENTVEGELITVRAEKDWVYDKNLATPPASIYLTLQRFTGNSNTPDAAKPGDTVAVNAAGNWTAEWTELPASKRYAVIESDENGAKLESDEWIAVYDPQTTTTDEDDNEIREFKITNTLKTGSLRVEKKWFGDEAASSVKVNVYRITEDQLDAAQDSGWTPVSYNDVSGGLSSSNRMYSMSRTKMLLNKLNTPQPTVKPMSRLTLNPVNSGMMAKGAEQSIITVSTGSDMFGTSIDVDGCAGCMIDKIQLVFSKLTSGQGQLVVNGNGIGITIDPAASTWEYTFNNAQEIESMLVNKWGITWDSSLLEVRFYYTPTTTLEIDKSTITMIEGDETKVRASNPTGTVSWSNTGYTDYFDFVDNEDNTATITAKKATPTTPTNTPAVLTVSDDTANLTAEITIEALEITNTDSTIKEGKTLVLTSNKPGAEFSIPQGTTCASLSDGQLTGLIPGQTVEVTVRNGSATAKKTFSIAAPDDFTVTSSAVAHAGQKVELTLSTSNPVDVLVPTGWSYTQNGNILEVTVGESNGTVEVTYQNITQTADITVTPLQIANPIPGATINKSYEFTVDSGTIATGGTVTWSVEDPEHAVTYSTEDGKLTVTTGEVLGTVTITATDGKGGRDEFTFKIDVTEAQANVPAGLKSHEPFTQLTITKDGSWLSDTLSNLPLTDGKGHKYIYYIEEIAGNDYKVISYDGNGKSLEALNGKMSLTNAAKEKADEEATLPETGGRGTAMYYTIGGMLLMLGAVGYVTIRRRRWSDG